MENQKLSSTNIEIKSPSPPREEKDKINRINTFGDNDFNGMLQQNTDDLASGIISSFISQIFDEDGLKKVDRTQLDEFIEVFGFGNYENLKKYKLDDIISVVTGEKNIDEIQKENHSSNEIKIKDFNEFDTKKQEKAPKSILGITIPIF